MTPLTAGGRASAWTQAMLSAAAAITAGAAERARLSHPSPARRPSSCTSQGLLTRALLPAVPAVPTQ